MAFIADKWEIELKFSFFYKQKRLYKRIWILIVEILREEMYDVNCRRVGNYLH